MTPSKRDMNIIDKFLREEEGFDEATESVCKNWWHCRSEASQNGYTIDTFSCKQHHAVDVKMVMPYTMGELKNALQKTCDGANSEEYCDVYRNNAQK